MNNTETSTTNNSGNLYGEVDPPKRTIEIFSPFSKDDLFYSMSKSIYCRFLAPETEYLESVVEDFKDNTYEQTVESTIQFWLTIRDIQAITTKLLEAKKLLGEDIIEQQYIMCL